LGYPEMTFAKILKANSCHDPKDGKFCSGKASFKSLGSGKYSVSFDGKEVGILRKGKGAIHGSDAQYGSEEGWLAEFDYLGGRIRVDAYSLADAKYEVNSQLMKLKAKVNPVRPRFTPEDLLDD
jgi:hypothetical protein